MTINPTIASGVISGGSSLLNNLISMPFNAMQNRKAFQQQKYLQQNAQEFQERMWNAGNEYNTPSAQMQRLRDAGVNPNSAFSGVQGTAQGSQPLGAPGVGSAPSPSYMPFEGINPNMSALSDAFKAQQEGEQAKANAEGVKIDNETRSERNNISISQAKAAIAKYKQEIDELKSRANLTDAQTRQVDSMLPILMSKGKEEIEQIKAATSHFLKQNEEIDSNISLLKEKLNTERAQQNAYNASAEESRSAAGLNAAKTETEGQNKTKAYYDAKISEYEQSRRHARRDYENALLMHGIDPDKIDYTVKNPVGAVVAGTSIAEQMRQKYLSEREQIDD